MAQETASPARTHRAILQAACAVLLCALTIRSASGAEVVEVLPLTDGIVMIHLREGHVIHHQDGQARSDEKVIISPLDTTAASQAGTYQIVSTDDPGYAQPQPPVSLGRKSKGTDFAWFVDSWDKDHAVNKRPDHTSEHWLYLTLPQPMQHGKTYTISTGHLATNGQAWKLRFDERQVRSEAVHVNILGYVPAAPQKYGYVFHWMGDKGSLDLKNYDGHAFHVVDQDSGKDALAGKLAFRMPASQVETTQKSDSPGGNFLAAEVYECDFSSLDRPGNYVLSVDGIGHSFPFRIDADIYRDAFRTVARGLYHNRSGIALTEPYTHFTRPAPHNPKLTPGFAGKLLYTTVRFTEWGSEGGNAKDLLAHANPAAGIRMRATGTAITAISAWPRNCSPCTKWRREISGRAS